MENLSRWLPTREAAAYLGVSSQFLKKNRDIKNGFLIEEKHYILGAKINSSILWNISEILKEFHYQGRLIRQGELIISELTNDQYRDRILTFESNPKWHKVNGEATISEKVSSLLKAPWGGSTDFTKAMDMIYYIVESNKLSIEDETYQ